ncbi:unnamed protein product [Schistocephalus solidus]|uniref:C2H2-type domain-containing protein n=1 Tax=Schistocephalus solidus TaxID=70667 RepID=A0A183SL00_SCHSO|nr:unnamed protein product [Schistocephalus solidus]
MERCGSELQMRWSGHLVRMDEDRLRKRLFYGDFAMGSRRQQAQVRRYKYTLKTFLNQLQISPANWEDLTRNRAAWRRTVKVGAEIYKANQIVAAEAKRVARQSPATRINTANAQAVPICPRCQCTFRARIGLVWHLRTQCNNATTAVLRPMPPTFRRTPKVTPGTNSPTPIIIETTSQYLTSVTSTTVATTIITTSDGGSVINCPRCGRTSI